MERRDVVVVGAGSAGLIAGRELSLRGGDVLVLEARDRIGGRTWTGPFADQEVELGGAYVHWYQAHVWAELTRYGLGIEAAPETARTVWLDDGGRHEGSPEALWDRLGEGLGGLYVDSRGAFPVPIDPLAGGEALERIDRMTVRDRLDELRLAPAVEAPVAALSAALSSAPLEEAGLSQLLRAFALADNDAELAGAINGRYSIAGGVTRLVEAIAADGDAEVRTSCPVAVLERHDGDVTVHPAAGEAIRAAVAILAAPINSLRTITFDPVLPPDKATVVVEGQASRGAKVWMRTDATIEPTLALAPRARTVPFVETVPLSGGGSLLLAFAPTNDAFVDARRSDVIADVEAMFSGVTLTAVGGHDWTSDPWSGGTWCCFRPLQLSRSLRPLQRAEGRLVFAGGDIADGWAGYIDGAIESGFRAAREAVAILDR